ncbi:MAG: phosphate ABC transporter substrate-binding protein PstS [Pseudomonadota bacterium]
MISGTHTGAAIALFIGLVFSALGCDKKEAPPAADSKAVSAAPTPAAAPVTLQGSGASFPAPLYSRWFREFSDKNKDVKVNYQSTGSGAGIKAFTEGQTDFGASDAAMSDDEIKAAKDNVILLPMTAGNIVLAYNLEGVPELKLSRDAYAGIFLGEIKKWDDPKIAKTNPGVKLPKLDISVVHRSDGSGTTFVFTQHLAAISEKWKAKPGVGKSVDWPVGVGGAKNDGVAAQIHQTPGAIGYIEFAFAASTKQPSAALENKAGKFIAPSLKSSATALAAVELPADMRAWVTDPAGDESYPIVTYTWILAHKKYDDKAKAAALKSVLKWSLTDGQKLSESLFYVPLPDAVAANVLKAVDTIE